MKKFCRHLENWALNIAFILAVVYLALNIWGIKSFIVTSGSMEPTIHTGAFAFVNERYQFDDIKKGDIVLYNGLSDTGAVFRVIHRIVDENAELDGTISYITKGDNNDSEDGVSVTAENYIGKYVFSIPYIGYGFNFLNKLGLKTVLIFAVVFAVCILIGFKIILPRIEEKDSDPDIEIVKINSYYKKRRERSRKRWGKKKKF